MNWLYVFALFVLLSPGVLLTLPAGSKGVFFSGQTSLAAAVVHGLVFVLVCCYFKRTLEGFADEGPAEGTRGCPPGQVRVSGACRSTCLLGKFNKGEGGCY
jgi:hypothetical protein